MPTSPTDPIAYIEWPRVAGNQQYFELGSSVRSGTNPHGQRMRFWNDMKSKIN